MDHKTKKFLQDQLIPDYASLLLELYSISYIQDLVAVDEDTLQEIEQNVRDGSFGGHTDFSSKADRIKYLGFPTSDSKQFSFRPLVKKKLLLISTAAAEALKAPIGRKKSELLKLHDEGTSKGTTGSEPQVQHESEEVSQVQHESEDVSQVQHELSQSQETSETSSGHKDAIQPPVAKKVKLAPEEKTALREAAFASKIIGIANSIWASTSVVERVDKSHVVVKYDVGKETMTAKVKCLFCEKFIVITATRYDATSMSSYKRHVTEVHLNKIVLDEKKSKQPTLQEMLDAMKADKVKKAEQLRGNEVDLTSDSNVATGSPTELGT